MTTLERTAANLPTAYAGTSSCPTCAIPVHLVSFAGRAPVPADWRDGAYRPHRCLLGGAAVVARTRRQRGRRRAL
jgi:hypothetical protein